MIADEMRDLEERLACIENTLSGIKITQARCPKCNHFAPIMTIMTEYPPIGIRCLNCLQELVRIDRYEIKEGKE